MQRYDAVVAAVDRKLEMLEKIAQRRVALATNERPRRISNVLGTLNALAVVSLAAALIGLLLGSRNPSLGPWWLSWLLVAIALSVAIALFSYTFTRVARNIASHSSAKQRQ